MNGISLTYMMNGDFLADDGAHVRSISFIFH